MFDKTKTRRVNSFSRLEIPPEFWEVESEVRLWRAVIDQLLYDFMTKETTEEAERNRRKAKIWLRGNSADFFEVCNMAALDPKLVRKAIHDLIGGLDVLYDD